MATGQGLFVGADNDRVLGPQDARIALAGLLATNSADSFDIRTGILWFGLTNLLLGNADLSVSVPAFQFVSSKGATNGPYLGSNKISTITVPAAPALGSKRIDTLWVAQQDRNAPIGADAATRVVFGVAGGDAGSNPSKPSAPDGTTEVGTIVWDSTSVVATSTNAAQCTLTTTCRWTTTRGNPIPVRDAAERNATIPNPYVGMRVAWVGSTSSGFTERYDGSTWVPDKPFREYTSAALVINSDVAAGSLAGPYPQTFPSGKFTLPPNLTFGTTDARCTVQGTSITKDGFNLYVRNNSSSTAPAPQTVWYRAVQATPTSTAG